jgi:Flp pilus assembly pilin Flp
VSAQRQISRRKPDERVGAMVWGGAMWFTLVLDAVDDPSAGSEGQSLLEYTLILALICLGAICAMMAVGQGIVQVFTIMYKALT